MRDQNLISAEIQATPERSAEAARALQRLGLRVLHIGPTISVEAPQDLWESVFGTRFEPRTQVVTPEVEGGEESYQRVVPGSLKIPPDLQQLIADIMFQEPPEFFAR